MARQFTEAEIKSNYDTIKKSLSSSEKTFEIIRFGDNMENMGKVGEIKIAKTDLPDIPSGQVDINREIINLSPALAENAGTFNYKLMVVNDSNTNINFFKCLVFNKKMDYCELYRKRIVVIIVGARAFHEG